MFEEDKQELISRKGKGCYWLAAYYWERTETKCAISYNSNCHNTYCKQQKVSVCLALANVQQECLFTKDSLAFGGENKLCSMWIKDDS